MKKASKMSLKVDFLLKQEIQYELNLRGISFEESQGVKDLRKTLRSALKINVKPNALNLNKVINLKEELQIIELNVIEIVLKTEEVKKDTELNTVIRLEHKINHYLNRIKNLENFKLEDNVKTKLAQVNEKLKSCSEALNELGVDQNEKETVERKLSESILEEEQLDDVFEKNVHSVNKLDISTNSVSNETKSFTYSKLPNPVEVYLKNFKACDGLDVRRLLEFLKNILKMKEETDLSSEQIIDLSLNYATGPLHVKILEVKSLKQDLDVLHKKLLSYFVPIGLRESLKDNLVTRPQRLNEPLNCYILDVKENSKLLNCKFSEGELVELITIGINPETRSKLVFNMMPSTFEDLDRMCIHAQNVAYENCRRSQRSYYRPVNQSSSNINSGPKCFNCGRHGHLARNCFRGNTNPRDKNLNQTPKQVPDQKPKSDPKNV